MRDRGDAEKGLERVFSPPAARSWAIDGWASVPNDVSDAELDRLAGVRGRFTSSSRFQGRPGLPRVECVRQHPAAVDRPVAVPRSRVVGVGGRGDDALLRCAWRRSRRPPAHAGPRASAICRRRRRSRSARTAPCASPRRCARSASGSRSCARPSRPARPGSIGSGGRWGSRRSVARASRGPRCAARGRSTPAAARSTSRSASAGARAHQRDARGPRRRAPARLLGLRAARAARRPGPAERRAWAAHALPAAPALAGLLPARSGAAGCRRLTGDRDPRRAKGVQVRSTARSPDPGRGLQPRAPRELRRPRPRRAVGRRRVRHRVERAGGLPRGGDQLRPEPLGVRGLRRVADRRGDPADRRRGRLATAGGRCRELS